MNESTSDERSTRRYYDDFATTYDRGRDRGYHALIDDLEVEVALPHVRGKKVLEAGCGSGLLLSRLAPEANAAVGADLSAGMLGGARARGLDVVQASLLALPFEDASFDTVYSFKVLAHIPDVGAAIEELARVTRPGGHLVLEVYNAFSLRYLARLIAGARRIGQRHTEADVPTRWVDPISIRRELPASLDLIDFRGVRVLTPFAAMHRVPFVAPLLARAERAAVTSPLRFAGGFLVMILRKRGDDATR